MECYILKFRLSLYKMTIVESKVTENKCDMSCDEQMGCYTFLLRWPVFLNWALRRLLGWGGGEGGKSH